MYNKNNRDPSIEPWGTADNTGRQAENNDPLITTF